MATTLKDVAQFAQVSVKTVSNVIHNHPHVSDDLRRRVQHAIDELDYRPNLAARNLRTGRTGLPSLIGPGTGAPHLDEPAREVVHTVSGQRYRIVVYQIGADRGEGAIPPVRSGARLQVDGVLLYADVESSERIEGQVVAVAIVNATGGKCRCDGLLSAQADR
jgi:DNA-binding LacI/PurR family transcriptional regulator